MATVVKYVVKYNTVNGQEDHHPLLRLSVMKNQSKCMAMFLFSFCNDRQKNGLHCKLARAQLVYSLVPRPPLFFLFFDLHSVYYTEAEERVLY